MICNQVERSLHTSHQFRNANSEAAREHFQHGQADVLFSTFHIGYVSTIYAEQVRHFDRRPFLSLAQLPDSLAEQGL